MPAGALVSANNQKDKRELDTKKGQRIGRKKEEAAENGPVYVCEAVENQRETNAYRWLKQCQRLAAGWGSALWGAGTLQQGAFLIHGDEGTGILHPIFLRWWPSDCGKERGKSLEEKTKRIIIVVYFWPELTANLLAADI